MIKGRGLFRFLGVIVAVAAMAVSCEPPVDTPEGKGLSLSWENGSLKLSYLDTDASLTVVARSDWTLSVTEGASWLGVPSVSSGTEGKTTVRFTFTENGGETTRTAKIRLVAEGEEDEPYECVITQTYRGVLMGVNEWIYNQMLGWYYWNDAMIVAEQPDSGLAYDEFLLKLVDNAFAKGAKDNTENPPTIDGRYEYENGIFSRLAGYSYSYIDRTAAGTRAEGTHPLTFGMGVTAIIGGNLDDRNQWPVLVTWVMPDGPADKAGIKRGTWIYRYNGRPIVGHSGFEAFWNQLYTFRGGTTLDMTGRDGTPYSVTAEAVAEDPFLHHEMITSEVGKQVAYLVYNSFDAGDDDVFDNRLREIFKEFKEAGATELVLDLRYKRSRRAGF